MQEIAYSQGKQDYPRKDEKIYHMDKVQRQNLPTNSFSKAAIGNAPVAASPDLANGTGRRQEDAKDFQASAYNSHEGTPLMMRTNAPSATAEQG